MIPKMAMDKIWDEFQRSYDVGFPNFNSKHEGLAIIREEYKEFEKAVFWKDGDDIEEVIQLAAMCLKYLVSQHELWNR